MSLRVLTRVIEFLDAANEFSVSDVVYRFDCVSGVNSVAWTSLNDNKGVGGSSSLFSSEKTAVRNCRESPNADAYANGPRSRFCPAQNPRPGKNRKHFHIFFHERPTKGLLATRKRFPDSRSDNEYRPHYLLFINSFVWTLNTFPFQRRG